VDVHWWGYGPDTQRFLAKYGFGKDQLAAGHGVVQLESVAIVNDRVAVGQLIPRVERYFVSSVGNRASAVKGGAYGSGGPAQ
jgi:hypothetical protein